MKIKQFIPVVYGFLVIAVVFIFSSCKKETSVIGNGSTTSLSSSQAIAVGVSSTTNDSIYVVNACSPHRQLDSVAASALPSSITDYLNTNYNGYTFQKAFAEKDSSANVTAYVVIIVYNGNPVGLKFDASGNFVQVLEQREGHDLEGKGFHEGGCFSDRDGRRRDTVSLSSIPAGIVAYIYSNYPQDTLVRAYQNADSSYILFSVDNGSYATLFDANGTFLRRVELHKDNNKAMPLSESDLSAAIQSYLTSTYPNYVFKQAFSFSQNGNALGYVVVIDANGTKYAVQFDASGNFTGAITVW